MREGEGERDLQRERERKKKKKRGGAEQKNEGGEVVRQTSLAGQPIRRREEAGA